MAKKKANEVEEGDYFITPIGFIIKVILVIPRAFLSMGRRWIELYFDDGTSARYDNDDDVDVLR